MKKEDKELYYLKRLLFKKNVFIKMIEDIDEEIKNIKLKYKNIDLNSKLKNIPGAIEMSLQISEEKAKYKQEIITTNTKEPKLILKERKIK